MRFKNLNVEAECHVGTRALPTLANASRDVVESLLGLVGLNFAKRKALHILKDVSGVVRPSRYCTRVHVSVVGKYFCRVLQAWIKLTCCFASRMTLVLGPPSSGKTTLLLALAGKLDPTLAVKFCRLFSRDPNEIKSYSTKPVTQNFTVLILRSP